MKLINEKLNIGFSRDGDKLGNLGVGKIVQIKNWLDGQGIINYEINDDFSIDVNQTVNIDKHADGNLPYYIQFNEINGNFYSRYNGMTSLKGFPRIVLGDCNITYNPIKSLEYAPIEIHGCFDVRQTEVPKEEYLKFRKLGIAEDGIMR
jgi:hypothetical protein